MVEEFSSRVLSCLYSCVDKQGGDWGTCGWLFALSAVDFTKCLRERGI